MIPSPDRILVKKVFVAPYISEFVECQSAGKRAQGGKEFVCTLHEPYVGYECSCERNPVHHNMQLNELENKIRSGQVCGE